MSDILREWLIHQLGVELHSFHPNNLCSKFQNGVFIGKLLQNYNIVSSNDFSLLVNQEDEAIKISNFRYLKTWLNMINILLDDDTVNGIISGQRSVIFGFLYKLCFILEDPNNLNLNEHAKKLYKSFGNVDILDNSNVSRKAISNLPHGKHYNHVDDSVVLPKKSIGNIKSLYDEINEFEDSLPMKLDCWDARGDQSCARYLSDLKGRKQQSKMYDSWRKEMINEYLQDSYDENMCHNQYVLRNKSMPDKLYRMSDCEKKMLEKVNNARFVMKKSNAIFVKNKVEFIKDPVGDERPKPKTSKGVKPNMKEKLIKRNNGLSIIELKNMVKSTVCELIEISVRRGAYKKTNGRDISKCLWDDWMDMFVEGRPMYNLPVGSRLGLLLLDFQNVFDNKLNTDEELKSQKILNRRDILKYLKGAEQELHVKSNQPPVVPRVLGFIVHDVFTSIYKLPAPLVAIDSKIFRPVMSVFNCEIEDVLKQGISAALIKRDILPVLPEVALQYCLYGYYRETDNNEIIQILENSENDDTKTAGENDSTIIEPVQLKQTQTPQNLITKYESERIYCGKNAFNKIYKGKPLSKYVLIDCVLCFIKEKNMQGGWVIFGLQREEIMILEERLAKQKHFPPFGLYSHMKNINPTILVPYKGPNYGDKGKYLSSLTSYLKIESYENSMYYDEWDDVYKYYRSQSLLTLLKYTDMNIFLNYHIIELFCNVLTGQIVNWSEVTNLIDCTYDVHQSNTSIISNSYISKTTEKTFRKEKLYFKSQFDFLDYLSSMFPIALYSLSQKAKNVIVEMTSKLFHAQLNKNDGTILAEFWKLLENEFVGNMERCFFYRRILIYEQEPFIIAANNYLNQILYQRNSKKLDVVRRLQYDLINIPNDTMTISNASEKLLSVVSDAKLILTQMISQKIKTCLDFIGDKIITNWLDKQINSIFKTYMCMLQVEVDRIVNTILFINTYMSKLHNQIVTTSLIPRTIDVSLLKNQTATKSIGDFYKMFNETINAVSDKIKIIFSKILEWLEEIENSRSLEPIKKDNIHLKVWKYLIKSEDLRSANQFQIILDQCNSDINEANNCLMKFKTDATYRINGRLQHESAGVECICNLFGIALKEKCYVRHEILEVDDNFYLNPENVLYPNIPPPRPFPLLEEEYPGGLAVNNLEIMTCQLALICPNRRISIIALSNWLMNFKKHDLPRIAWFDTTTEVLRSIFGCSVHYVDWSDFVIHCLELSYPSVDDLLDLKNQYATAEKTNKNYLHSNHTEGTIDKDEYDSVLLWYQKTLPSNPSVCLRYMKIKDLLFTMFSIGGKLDYIIMLLALCKDNSPVMGLLKAISLVLDRNIMVDIDLKDDISHGNEKHDIELLIETIYKTSFICLKNYLAPDKRDINDLMFSVLNIRSTMCKRYGDKCSIMELIKNEEFKTLSEVGFRFNSRSLLKIVNNLK